MSLARSFQSVLRRQFHMHAAWVPAVTEFRLGDYGLWRGGVFVALGNVDEFGVEIQEVEGHTARLDFISEDARVTTFSAGGAVAMLPDSDGEARLAIELPSEDSFILKCPELRSRRIGNVAQVVRALHASYRRGGAERWLLRYKVVGELFTADDFTLLATRSRGTHITFRGKARLLQQLGKARVDASLGMQSDRQLALDIRNASGPIGLGLFRVTIRGVAAVNFDDADAGPIDLDIEGNSLAELIAEDRWDDEPVDDEPGGDDEHSA